PAGQDRRVREEGRQDRHPGPERHHLAAAAFRDPPPWHAREPLVLPAAAMIPTLVFDLETIPDADGLRRLNPEWADLDDAALIEAAPARRRETPGDDFRPPHLQATAVTGCGFR